jgi:hypothetical protein
VGSGRVLYDCEVSIGREILWFGSFEDEGHTMWNTNSDDEWIDSTVAYAGSRSLVLRRNYQAGMNVVTNLEDRIALDAERRYSMMGHLRTQNAGGATFEARYHQYRYSWSSVGFDEIVDPLVGDHDWGFHWANMTLPENANYLDPRASLNPPDTGMGYAWFDEIKVVEFEDWGDPTSGVDVPFPGNLKYAQVRTTTQVESLFVVYETTQYDGGYGGRELSPAGVQENRPGLRYVLAENFPDPFRSFTRISYAIPAACHVTLNIYDVSGRKVSTLLDERQEPGTRTLTWDGGSLPSGLYFYRLEAGEFQATRKMLLLR